MPSDPVLPPGTPTPAPEIPSPSPTPGPDIAPFHDRQIVLLRRAQALEWLNLTRPEADLLTPAPAGSLEVEKVFPLA